MHSCEKITANAECDGFVQCPRPDRCDKEINRKNIIIEQENFYVFTKVVGLLAIPPLIVISIAWAPVALLLLAPAIIGRMFYDHKGVAATAIGRLGLLPVSALLFLWNRTVQTCESPQQILTMVIGGFLKI